MKIHAKTLVPVVLDFLVNYIGEEEAEEFAKICGTTMEDASENPLVKAGGFNALLKLYLRQYPSMKDKIAAKEEPVEKDSESSSEESDTKDEKEAEKAAPKAQAAKKNEKKPENPQSDSSESEDSDESSSEEEVKPKAAEANKVAGKKRKHEEEDEEEEEEPAVNKRQKTETNEVPVAKNTRAPFSRIGKDYANGLSREFQDNSFEAKVRYGQGGDDYGIHSNERLRVVAGKDFRKEKTKMKKKNFHGAGNKLVYKVNSIKF